MDKIKRIFNILDIVFFVVLIYGCIFVAWQKYSVIPQNYTIFIACIIPFILNKIIGAFVTSEVIIQGMPKVAKRRDDPNLYWLVVGTYMLFLVFCIVALI